jgi:predicted hydrocarbon binding protein
MPFDVRVFQENALPRLKASVREELKRLYAQLDSVKTPPQKAASIHLMMDVLDRNLDEQSRRSVMEACGRRCIGSSTLEKVRHIRKAAQDVDDLLLRLNKARIGGGDLKREGDIILVTYSRCYCGSVSRTRERFSPTYCYCSCGYCRQLFETALGRPVEVELLGSVIQGDDSCRFCVRI